MRTLEGHLGDTNIMLRYYHRHELAHEAVKRAVDQLLRRGAEIYVAQQTLMEFWNVSTRPIVRNGFGMTPAQTDVAMGQLELQFPILPEPPQVYAEWRRLVTSHEVSGAQVHDAHLVAVMRVHELSHILTFNARDFVRYPGITPVHPDDVQ